MIFIKVLELRENNYQADKHLLSHSPAPSESSAGTKNHFKIVHMLVCRER